IDLGQASSLLQSGDNLLTIQVHNQSSSGAGGLLLGADLNLASGASILDGDGSWKFFAGLAAPSGGLVDHGLLTLEAAEAPDVLWATTSFDDSTWPVGVGPVGYDISSPPDYVTGVNLITEMRGVTPSVYTRSNFTVTQAEADSAFPLSLVVDFDDGMIVYVNGFEVFRDNVGTAGAVTPHDVPADGNHAATEDVANATDHSLTIALDAARDLLVPGNNVIGVQLHNASAFSSDLIGRVTLRTTGASPRDLVVPSSSLRYFVGTEEPVLQGEEDDIEVIADPFDSENDWIEIRNTDSAEVSLDGWSLSDDPTDPRKWSFPTGVVVPADGYLVVVASGLGLTQRGDGMTFDHTNFKLSAAGDRLVLTRPDDQVEDQLLVNYPAQSWRYSYGRQADGAFGYLSLGTPGAANVGSVLGNFRWQRRCR
ncbi:lamin tail domain-containing protein, partial [Akkermansiaceae bacterium]|nr:lamin tail domain-containing protein [Akkermansiaceae bacterium]